MKRLIIIGASGHGKVVCDIASLCGGYSEILFLDDAPTAEFCLGRPIVGGTCNVQAYREDSFIVAIGNPSVREAIQSRLAANGFQIATLVHPRAVIGSHVTIGCGTVIMAGAVINPDTSIGDGCIINTCASVDHDNILEDYVHVSVGSHLSGTVRVGKGTWIGAGATVSNNIQICANCMIGAGAVVVRDLEIPGTYVGIPARRLK